MKGPKSEGFVAEARGSAQQLPRDPDARSVGGRRSRRVRVRPAQRPEGLGIAGPAAAHGGARVARQEGMHALLVGRRAGAVDVRPGELRRVRQQVGGAPRVVPQRRLEEEPHPGLQVGAQEAHEGRPAGPALHAVLARHDELRVGQPERGGGHGGVAPPAEAGGGAHGCGRAPRARLRRGPCAAPSRPCGPSRGSGGSGSVGPWTTSFVARCPRDGPRRVDDQPSPVEARRPQPASGGTIPSRGRDAPCTRPGIVPRHGSDALPPLFGRHEARARLSGRDQPAG